MKKITLIVFLIISSLGFSQNLVINGDFQTGVAAPEWYNNAANVVDLGGGNFVNQAEVTATGTAFSVNLSQAVTLEAGKTYEFSFVAFTDATTGSRSMVSGVGEAGDNFEAYTDNPALTPTPQTFTYQYTINYSQPAASRVLFDMGAELGFVFIDDVSLVEIVDLCNDGILNNGETEIDCGGPNCSACPSPPTVAAPTPPNRPAADVVSIYSDAYAAISPINLDAGWCGSGAVTATTAGGNAILAYNNQACQGINFETDLQDVTGFTNIHVDLFIQAGTDLVGKVFNMKIVPTVGAETAFNVDINALSPAPVPGTWYSYDATITLSGPTTNIKEFGVTSNLNNVVWYDNLYLHKNTVLSNNDFNKTTFSAYPNPTQNSWTVKGANAKIESINVFDILGKVVLKLSPNTSEARIDGSTLKAGIYFAQIKTLSGIDSVKLIKQ
ncbi:endoglucanase [Jejuia pallidilutea]|uniref:Endoglucanase n=1 Tax=Jejuia pallidilutea TaxID=504487 RepID=A0A362X145_9FLAO|nr:T9SS type A sorting domain-containing protein [Jejuia pallidilutea]PQV49611.1 endoglucanase [Jejuia pallidilutea]